MPRVKPPDVLAKDARLNTSYWMVTAKGVKEVRPLEKCGDSVRCSAQLVENGPKTRKYMIPANTVLFTSVNLAKEEFEKRGGSDIESPDVSVSVEEEAPVETKKPEKPVVEVDKSSKDTHVSSTDANATSLAAARLVAVMAAKYSIELMLEGRRTEAFNFAMCAMAVDNSWKILPGILRNIEQDTKTVGLSDVGFAVVKSILHNGTGTKD